MDIINGSHISWHFRESCFLFQTEASSCFNCQLDINTTQLVWRALEEGKMSAIAEGVSRGYRETSEEERRRVRENIIRYIISQSKTSGHKVTRRHWSQSAQ